MDKKSNTSYSSQCDNKSRTHAVVSGTAIKSLLFRQMFDPEFRARLNSSRKFSFGFTSPGSSATSGLVSAKPTRYLRIERVRAITGLATSTLYRLMKHGQFPRPVQLGPNCVGWSEEEVSAWCSTRKPRNRPPRG